MLEKSTFHNNQRTRLDLYNGDCLEVLAALEGESVDLVFADPPFNVGKKYGGKTASDNRADYYEWCAAWIAECFRVLKPTGSFYLMTLDRHVGRKMLIMEKWGVLINLVKWYNVAAVHSPRKFILATQPILFYGKTGGYKFNTYAQTRKADWIQFSGDVPRGQLMDLWNDIPFVYAGGMVHREAILQPGTKHKAHPAQMPTALSSRAILFSTDAGDTVLDPFSGSFTTAESCARLGRNFIGIELEAEYYRLGCDRIATVLAQPQLDLNKMNKAEGATPDATDLQIFDMFASTGENN